MKFKGPSILVNSIRNCRIGMVRLHTICLSIVKVSKGVWLRNGNLILRRQSRQKLRQRFQVVGDGMELLHLLWVDPRSRQVEDGDFEAAWSEQCYPLVPAPCTVRGWRAPCTITKCFSLLSSILILTCVFIIAMYNDGRIRKYNSIVNFIRNFLFVKNSKENVHFDTKVDRLQVAYIDPFFFF